MSIVENIISAVKPHNPKGAIHVVDRSPLNWLYITYNTVEELVRTDEKGHVVPAAMESYKWIDDKTLEIKLRKNKFQDGEKVTAKSVKRSFEEMMKWRSPHPPGTQFNQYVGTRCEMVDEETRAADFAETRRDDSGQIARDARYEHALLGRSGIRLQAKRQRRRSLVSD